MTSVDRGSLTVLGAQLQSRKSRVHGVLLGTSDADADPMGRDI